MLTVACVESRNYLGMGGEYVRRLRSMVCRHLAQPFRFVCITDDPKRHALAAEEIHFEPIVDKLGQLLTGWWAKLYLFSPGRFSGRVLYLDLDTVITGPLDELVLHKGAVNLRDWGWNRDVSAGGTLLWDGGEHADLWAGAAQAPKRYENDQEYITALGGWPRLPAHLVRSYRYHSKAAPPPGCVAVGFHGKPKPHELTAGWVPAHWR